MAKKNFLLLSLEDSKTRKVANVVSNDSCRRILDHLAEREATESELAKKLGMPISTVHYNLQQLMETGLIAADTHHYSAKGREVNHYRLANKYIIIAPKSTYGIKEKLRSILPAFAVTLAVAGLIEIFSNMHTRMSQPAAETAPFMASKMADTALDSAASGAAFAMQAPELAAQSAPLAAAAPAPGIAVWFLLGSLCALAAMLAISMIRKRPDSL